MLRYVLRRVLIAIPTLIGAMLLIYCLFFAFKSPEVIARQNLGQKNPSQAQIRTWLDDHGYGEVKQDEMQQSAFGKTLLAMGIKPKESKPGDYKLSTAARLMQLKRSCIDVLGFHFGKSDTTGQDIWTRVRDGAGPSLLVGSIIFVTALTVSLLSAVAVAYFRGTYVDRTATIVTTFMLSCPYMVYMIGLQYYLGKKWEYGPIWGFDREHGLAKFLTIPVIVGVIAGIGGSIRLYRTFLLDETSQDYVRTARAKGVPEASVLLKHVLKNALIPVLTGTVAAIPTLILGQLLLETFFGIPGLGSYLNDAITNSDFAVVRAMVFLGTLLTLVGYILTDIAYAIVDPRVRLE